MKINGSLARVAIRELAKQGLIKQITHHHGQLIYSQFNFQCWENSAHHHSCLQLARQSPQSRLAYLHFEGDFSAIPLDPLPFRSMPQTHHRDVSLRFYKAALWTHGDIAILHSCRFTKDEITLLHLRETCSGRYCRNAIRQCSSAFYYRDLQVLLRELIPPALPVEVFAAFRTMSPVSCKSLTDLLAPCLVVFGESRDCIRLQSALKPGQVLLVIAPRSRL